MFQKRHKYWSAKIELDWIKFDSKKEAWYYQQLKLLEKAWKIKDLELQPTYELQSTFKYKWEHIRAIKYVADFVYFDTDKKVQVIVDVKWFKTKDYLLKKKLFLNILKDHNDTIFQEI